MIASPPYQDGICKTSKYSCFGKLLFCQINTMLNSFRPVNTIILASTTVNLTFSWKHFYLPAARSLITANTGKGSITILTLLNPFLSVISYSFHASLSSKSYGIPFPDRNYIFTDFPYFIQEIYSQAEEFYYPVLWLRPVKIKFLLRKHGIVLLSLPKERM